jgi:hypothetical protein
MRPDIDPLVLTPDDRLREVAAVLACGLLRLHARPSAPDPAGHPASKNLPDSSPNCLELPGETVLSVHTG